jgi:hypothetical protein
VGYADLCYIVQRNLDGALDDCKELPELEHAKKEARKHIAMMEHQISSARHYLRLLKQYLSRPTTTTE